MVTNVSVPIYRCDICGTTFKQDRAAAQRCEDAGTPVVLPAGSLLLDYEQDRYLNGVRCGGFRLRRLYPFPDQIGTLAGTYDQASGHTATYAVDVDPARHRNDRGYYDWPGHSQPMKVRTQDLAPYAPGVLTMISGRWIGRGHGARSGDDPSWVLDAVGLPRGDITPGPDTTGVWVRPLTPQVRAVLDALDAWPNRLTPQRGRSYHQWTIRDRLMSYALGLTRARDGSTSIGRAKWFLRGADEATLTGQVYDLWRRWRGGTSSLDRAEPEPIHVPRPRLISTRPYLTASKLTRDLRALVAAAGFDWPARTDATAYCNLLINHTLEYRMDLDHQLFPGTRVIAVCGRKGGVGKSTVAAALARRLAADGHRAALIDCDLTGPSQHVIHNLGAVTTDPDRTMILPAYSHGLRVFSPGQLFGPATKSHWDDTTVQEWLSFIGTSLDLDDTEIVVLDMPPGDGPVHSVIGSHHVHLAAQVHVTTGHPFALADTERDLADGAMRGRRWLLENLSRVTGTVGMGQTVEVRLHGVSDDAPELAERTGTRWAGSLPWAHTPADLADTPEIGKLAAELTGQPADPETPRR